MNSPGTIPPIVLTLATVKHDDELTHEVFVADIDGVTVVPPDRARVDGEEGDTVHAAPKTAIAIRTVTTRAPAARSCSFLLQNRMMLFAESQVHFR